MEPETARWSAFAKQSVSGGSWWSDGPLSAAHVATGTNPGVEIAPLGVAITPALALETELWRSTEKNDVVFMGGGTRKRARENLGENDGSSTTVLGKSEGEFGGKTMA